MPLSDSSHSELLKAVLLPLLDDFLYWFERSHQLLDHQPIAFLSQDAQADLLARVQQAQQEVRTAKLLFEATDGKVGIESTVLEPWHLLVTECWQIAARVRMAQSLEYREDS